MRRSKGQTGTEYMLVISVIVLAVVGASYRFVPQFEAGVNALGLRVQEMLRTGFVGGGGGEGPDPGNGGPPMA